MGKYYMINGHKLYIETFGNPCGEPILYLHGKPGTGVLDLVEFQKERLAKEFYVIAPEQYGVFRSERIRNQQWGIEYIVDDYEEIRKKFKIRSWNLLSHCIGSYYILLYTYKYSEHVKKIIMESPIIDVMESNKQIIKYQINLLSEMKGSEVAENYVKKIGHISNISDLKSLMSELQNEVGKERNSYMISKKTLRKIECMKEQITHINEYFNNSIITASYLAQEFYTFNWRKCLNSLRDHDCLLMIGKQDVMVKTDKLKFIMEELGNSCHLIQIEDCQHWIKIDQPVAYQQVITEFFGGHL